MSFSKEGYGIIAACFTGTLILLLGWKLNHNINLLYVACIMFIIGLFCCYFFRDPKREIDTDEQHIVSPGDGKIDEIVEVTESEYLQSKAIRVALILTIFDVHISRIPIDGQVEFLRYQRGKFLPVYNRLSVLNNEQTIIGVNTKYGKILFKQIAGMMARRIVCYIREGHVVKKGEKFGIIKFGSRMEIYLPSWARVTVKEGERVKAGETVIGIVNEE